MSHFTPIIKPYDPNTHQILNGNTNRAKPRDLIEIVMKTFVLLRVYRKTKNRKQTFL